MRYVYKKLKLVPARSNNFESRLEQFSSSDNKICCNMIVLFFETNKSSRSVHSTSKRPEEKLITLL